MKIVGSAVMACALGSVAWAQLRGGGAEWLTAQGDAQRTSWIRADAAISPEIVSQPGFTLQWKTRLANQARGDTSLTQGVTANGVTLFVPMSLVAGSSNNLYAIDNEIGYTVWQRHFEAALPAATAACPGGITAAATRIVDLVQAEPAAGRAGGGGGGGRGGYRTALGEPGEGAPLEAAQRGAGAGRGAAAAAPPAAAPGAAPVPTPGAAAPGAQPGAPPVAGAARGAAPAAGAPPAGGQGGRGGQLGNGGIPGAPATFGGGYGRPAGVVYTVSSDGILHVIGLQSGKDLQKPAQFLPANARWADMIAVNETLYAATTGGCGGAADGVYAIDLASEAKPVVSWKTNGGGVTGLAFATDGTLLATVGPGQAAAGGYANAIVALDPKTLQLKDWFTDSKTEFASTPLVFKATDKDIVAAAAKDGRILLLDVKSLGGQNHSTPLFASRSFAGGGAFAPGALAMWQQMLPAVPGQTAANPAAAPGGQAAQAPPPQGAPPAGVPQGPLTTLQGAPGTPGGAPVAAPASSGLPGTRWLLVPVNGALPADAQVPGGNAVKNGAILALKIVDEGGKLSLQPGWVSRDLPAPATPIIVNGVVFALASGKPQGAAAATAADLAKRGAPAVLYALNGSDGKELWSSGKTMTSFLSGRSFWSATGQVYVGTFDGTLYAFGITMERR